MPPQETAVPETHPFGEVRVPDAVEIYLQVVGALGTLFVFLFPFIKDKLLKDGFVRIEDAVTPRALSDELRGLEARINTAMTTVLQSNYNHFTREVERVARDVQDIKGAMQSLTESAVEARSIAAQALTESQSTRREIDTIERGLSSRIDGVERNMEGRFTDLARLIERRGA